jgi:hypothetical protein
MAVLRLSIVALMATMSIMAIVPAVDDGIMGGLRHKIMAIMAIMAGTMAAGVLAPVLAAMVERAKEVDDGDAHAEYGQGDIDSLKCLHTA